MSLFNECLGCLEGTVTIKTMLQLTTVKDSDNSHYLNIKFNEKEQCDDYTPAVDCGSHVTVEELLKRLIVEDDCDMCAWNIIANICDACD